MQSLYQQPGRPGQTLCEVVRSVVIREYRSRAPGRRYVVPPGRHEDRAKTFRKIEILQMLGIDCERSVGSKYGTTTSWLKLLIVWSRIAGRLARGVGTVEGCVRLTCIRNQQERKYQHCRF